MKKVWTLFLLLTAAASPGRAADVARIGAQGYPTLDAAVAAAHSNDVIVLIGDAIVTNTLSLAVPLSIVGDGAVRTLTRTHAFNGDLLYVPAAGSLTLGEADGSDAAPTLFLDGGSGNGVTGGYSFIFAESGDVTLHPGVVVQNYSGNYAPIYMLDTTGLARLTLNGGRFAHNIAMNSSGGAVCSQGANIDIHGTSFIGNAAPHGRGGAIYLENGLLVADDVTIQGNSSDDFGGGIMGLPGEMILTGGLISSNSAINGGGVANAYGLLTVDGTRFSCNRAFYGGAIWSHTATNTLRSTSFRNNQTTNFGAALYSTSSRFAISNCQIVANTAGSNGGGLYVSPATNPPSTIAILSSVVASNSGLYGGAVYSSYADLSIADSTLSHNTASGAGGALWLFGSTTLRDTAVLNNAASNEGGAIFHLGGPLSLSGQTRLEGNAGTPGNGIWSFNGAYEGTNAVLSLSGGVSIAADNEVFLQTTTNAILLAGALFAPSTVATIIPAIYSNGLPLLRDAAGLSFSPVARFYGKFAVTPETNGTPWYVGTNGNLAATLPPPPAAPPAELREIVSFGAAATGSPTFQFSIDPLLLDYAFAVQSAHAVIDHAWNFQTLTNGYVVSTNGTIALDSLAPSRVYRLTFP